MPLHEIDIRTVFFLTTCVSVTTAVVIVMLLRNHREEISLPTWAMGTLLIAAGYLAVSLRGSVPAFLSIPLANTCITVGHACFLRGVDRLTGHKPLAWSAIAALGLLIIVSLSYFTYVQESTAARILIQFVAIGPLSVTTGLRLLKTKNPVIGQLHSAVAAVFMAYGLLLLTRVGLMTVELPGNDLLAPLALDKIVFVVMLLFNAALMFSFPALLFAKKELALRESQDDFQKILAITDDGFWTVSPDGRLIAVNDGYVRQSGYRREELLAMSVSDLEAVEDEQDAAAHIQRVLETGRDQFATLHRRKDGSTWHVDASVIYIPVNGGRFFSWFRDISERKAHEEELIAARDQLRATLRAIPDLLFEIDLDGRYHEVYATNKELLAAPVENLLSGKTIHEVLPEEATEVILSALREANEQGSSYGKQIELPLPQGRLWFELSVAKKPSQTNFGARFIVLSRDITARKHTEADLSIITDRLTEAQRIALIGNWSLNAKTGELYWSDEIFRLFEIDPTRFQPTYEGFLNAIHPEDKDAVNKAYTESVANRAPYEIDHRLLMADGRVKWVHEHCHSEFDAAGAHLLSVGTVQDITARREAENALLASEQSKSAILNSVAASVSVIDQNGVIREVNEPWRRFALENASEPGKPAANTGVGSNYLTVCEHSVGPSSDHALAAREGIQAVLDGRLDSFRLEYPCHSPTHPRWFIMFAVPLGQGQQGAVITHTDITLVKQSEEQIRIAAAAFES